MVAGWLFNRRVTFRVTTRPRLAEFFRYAIASSFGAAVNYAVFSALLLMTAAAPVPALILASLIAAAVSYAGYRHIAFPARKTAAAANEPACECDRD